MKNTIKRTVMGTAIALAAMGASAAEISLTPDAGVDLSNIAIDQVFNLNVVGSDFSGIDGFEFIVSWQPTELQLNSTVTDIFKSVRANAPEADLGVGDEPVWNNTGSTSVDQSAGVLKASFINDASFLGLGSITATNPVFFSLSFKAIPPAETSTVSTGVGIGGGVIDIAGLEVSPLIFNDVQVVTNEVPLPAAVWLFGTGLLGLAGIARRRNPAEA